MSIQPYLFFEGQCDEAIEFYRKALGAEVAMLMRYKEAPPPPEASKSGSHGPPANGDKVMHASLRIGDTTVLVSDGRCSGKPNFQGFALSLTVATVAEAEKLFAALAAGRKINMPLAQTFFSPRFGMLQDRLGVNWMVYVTA